MQGALHRRPEIPMPGILLNRLSRPKAGESPSEQLAKGRAILRGEMLPVLCPGGKEDVDYLYLEDIESRLKVHQEGEILDRALKVMKAGRCHWLAVTEIPRLTGDLATSAQILSLCRDHEIPIYTRERLRYPYEPWRPESEQELYIALMLSGLEVIGYRGRVQRAFAAAYPIDPSTGESRLKTFEGLGRHVNGRVPRGYVWDKAAKQPRPDERIPAPDYIAPGQSSPAALTWFEIVRRVRELGLTLGAGETQDRIVEECGVTLSPYEIVYIWHNAFYAGRPTSTTQKRSGQKQTKRAIPVATIGTYPPVDSWELHQELQAAVRDRQQHKPKTGCAAWASGLILCGCGERWLSWGQYYRCRGDLQQYKAAHAERQRLTEATGEAPISARRKSNHRAIDGWEKTPACGMKVKPAVEEHVTLALRRAFALPGLAARLADYEAEQRESSADRQQLRRQTEALQSDLRALETRRQNVIDMGETGALRPLEIKERLHKLEHERTGIENQLQRLQEALTAPPVPSSALATVRQVLSLDFDDFWYDADALTDSDRKIIAAAVIDHIPVIGTGQRRALGTAVYRTWVQG